VACSVSYLDSGERFWDGGEMQGVKDKAHRAQSAWRKAQEQNDSPMRLSL